MLPDMCVTLPQYIKENAIGTNISILRHWYANGIKNEFLYIVLNDSGME